MLDTAEDIVMIFLTCLNRSFIKRHVVWSDQERCTSVQHIAFLRSFFGSESLTVFLVPFRDEHALRWGLRRLDR